MTANLNSNCQSAECQATFTINGERGNQKFSFGCMVTLQADEKEADTYLWELISSPPKGGNLLTGITLAQARLALPLPGTYVVQLTVTKGDCTAQERRIILVGASDCLPYPCSPYYLSEDDIAAIENAAGTPNGENPFVTQEQLDNYLSVEDKAAIEEAAGIPSSDNPFVTQEQLDNYLSQDAKAAIEKATIRPEGTNPFITQKHLDDYLSEGDKAAIENATIRPHGQNPFITQEHLLDYLSGDDKSAIENATIKPAGDNPFVTQKHLDNLRQEYFLSQDDIDAIQLAQGFPNNQNPFVTQKQLDHYLAEDKKDAIDYASEDANADNPFVVRSEIITGPKRAAVDHAIAEANGQNPFVARSEIITGPKKAAILSASDSAGADNPFITHQEVADKLAVIKQPEEQPVRIVAAGMIDLSQRQGVQSSGGLITLVDSDPAQGLATLTFAGYDFDQCHQGVYVIKALPITEPGDQPDPVSGTSGQFPRPIIVVQFVRFFPQGFQLHMVDLAQLPAGRPRLGPCMIEVSKINRSDYRQEKGD